MKLTKVKKLKLFICVLLIGISLFSSTIAFADSNSDIHYIGTTSDVHGNISNLKSWLSNLDKDSKPLDYMIFGGDYVGPKEAENCVKAVNEESQGTQVILAKGNHEIDEGGSYDSGLVVNNDDYAIYVMDSSSKSFTKTDMDNIKSSLKSIKPSVPVFIISHVPIHYFGERSTGNASELLSILNDYNNVIFLWGHNHTVHDTNYGKIKKSGDTIQYSKSSSPVVINFTYGSMGAMSQGNNDAYGLLMKITKESNSKKIDFEYKDISGRTVSNYTINI